MEGTGYPQLTPVPIFEDNRAYRMMSENPVAYERSKHIDYRVHALRDRVAKGHVGLLDCPTHDMVADYLTKAVTAETFERVREVAGGNMPHTAPEIPDDLTKAGPRVFEPRDPNGKRPISKWTFPILKSMSDNR
jgi:hypothetical protein